MHSKSVEYAEKKSKTTFLIQRHQYDFFTHIFFNTIIECMRHGRYMYATKSSKKMVLGVIQLQRILA